MKFISLKCEDEGERLDLYLSEEVDDFSRSKIQKLIKDKYITVNGKSKKPSYKLEYNDVIDIIIPKEEEFKLIKQNLNLDIIYEDDHIAVINKPQGMVIHPAPGNPDNTLVNGLLYQLDKLSSINGEFRPGIVHRLDKDTSGLVVIAKDNYSHKCLSEQFKNRTVGRKYLALTFGNLNPSLGCIKRNIGRSLKDRKKMSVLDEGGREAITHYKVVEYLENYSLVSLSLETGRTHQIRVHLSSLNNPIVGDQLYSRGKNEFGLKKQFLHSYELSFIHPKSKEKVTFTKELPDNLNKVLEILRRRSNEN